MKRLVQTTFLAMLFASIAFGQAVAVIDPLQNELSLTVSTQTESILAKSLETTDGLLANDALKYAAPEDPFNQSVDEAKSLGLRAGAEFVLILKSDTLRKSTFGRTVYFDSYAAFFLIESRSGRLVYWNAIVADGDSREDSTEGMLKQLPEAVAKVVSQVNETYSQKRSEDQEFSEPSKGVRLPMPYARKKPAYTDLANRFLVSATVDVAVTVDANGEVVRTEILRWAGFGLEDSVIANVRGMNWRPADKNGKAFTTSVLLRYNFRDVKNDD